MQSFTSAVRAGSFAWRLPAFSALVQSFTLTPPQSRTLCSIDRSVRYIVEIRSFHAGIGEQAVNLIEISTSGAPAEEIQEFPAVAAEIGAAYTSLYSSFGFMRPWLGYFASMDSVCIGTCGFKGPPQDARVEIAYFTFSEYEGRGYATSMARALIGKAWEADPELIIAAQTLPSESASTSILKRLGFTLIGSVDHPEDGEVWEWQLRRREATGTA